ncbi:MAG: ATP-binding protein [Eubacterium sp.]|nr:ATP-binding protein [Eubacterium sp.]
MDPFLPHVAFLYNNLVSLISLLLTSLSWFKFYPFTTILFECARNRYSTYFVSFENLMIQLKKALNENRLEQRMKFFSRYKILIIDEIGYMPIDADSANLFFQLVARRYKKHCKFITTNMPFQNGVKYLDQQHLLIQCLIGYFTIHQ